MLAAAGLLLLLLLTIGSFVLLFITGRKLFLVMDFFAGGEPVVVPSACVLCCVPWVVLGVTYAVCVVCFR